MACPVHEYGSRSREVYFPGKEGWYDLYSGRFTDGGQSAMVDAPYEQIPLFARAGSIIPQGPEIMYSNEKQPEAITLYVYAGRNGTFTLYEDDGMSYDYEKGDYMTITFTSYFLKSPACQY